MSAFLFKQTETAGADCACEARMFGRGTGPAPRARARTRTPPQGRARPGGAEGGEPPGPRRLAGKAGSGEELTGRGGRHRPRSGRR